MKPDEVGSSKRNLDYSSGIDASNKVNKVKKHDTAREITSEQPPIDTEIDNKFKSIVLLADQKSNPGTANMTE